MPFGAIRSRVRGLLISNFQTARFSLGRKPAHLASACSISLARIHSRSVLECGRKRRKTSGEGGRGPKKGREEFCFCHGLCKSRLGVRGFVVPPLVIYAESPAS
jgi:hypothetical protein